MKSSESRARRVKRRHSSELLKQPGVAAVGIERTDQGDYYLAVHVQNADPALWKRIPAEIEGCPVRLVVSGEYRKLGGAKESKSEAR